GRPGEREEVRALGLVEAERARDRVEHLGGGVDVAALLQARVPGDADPGELCDLLAPQPRRAPPPRRDQADALGRDPLAPAADEGGQLVAADLVVAGGEARAGEGHAIRIATSGTGSLAVLVPG